MNIPEIPKGHNRQWVKCPTCEKAYYYDYVPYSLSTPIMTLPCHHRFEDTIRISADEAVIIFAKQLD